VLCSFCSKSEPVRIDISSLNLRICPNCLAAFLPASQFAALRRDINDSTKGAWVRKLQNINPETVPGPDTPPVCLEHGSPLVDGIIPNYGFNGLVPACCDLQHLPPSLMIKILEIGIEAGIGGLTSFSSRKMNPISEFLGGIIFRFWQKRQKNVDDGLDRLQYNFKFKDVLGEWIDQ
jgi:hypothetical protein